MAVIDLAASLQGDSSLVASLTEKLALGSPLVGVSTLGSSLKLTAAMAAPLVGSSSLGASINVSTGPAVVLQTLPSRVVPSRTVVFNQVDFFMGDGKTRQQGLLPSDITLKLFVGPSDVSWPLVSGVGVPDVLVSSGNVYFQEFEAGYYSFRFFPNMLGTWRIVLSWAAGTQGISQSFDIFQPAPVPSGLRSTFIKSR